MRTNVDIMLKTAANNILSGEETKKFELIFIKNCIDGIKNFLDKEN